MCGGLEVLPLAAELDEDRDLLADDLRIERLDEVVGAPGCVGPVDLLRVLAERGDEMMGMWRLRSSVLRCVATSKPFIRGMATSISATAKRSRKASRSASSPEVAVTTR